MKFLYFFIHKYIYFFNFLCYFFDFFFQMNDGRRWTIIVPDLNFGIIKLENMYEREL